MSSYYSQEIQMPSNMQEGLQNFVQMIINDMESGMTRESLLKAVDLKQDLDCNIYEVKG